MGVMYRVGTVGPSGKMLIMQNQEEELHGFGLGIQCYASSFNMFLGQSGFDDQNLGLLRNVPYIDSIDHISRFDLIS